jgi:DNA polymerase-3 subunit gamma/tau
LARKNTPRSEAVSTPGTGAAAVAPAPEPPPAEISGEPVLESELPERVIAAAEGAGFNDLANLLRNGQWKTNGAEVVVEVPDPPVLVQMAMSNRQAIQAVDSAISAALGRPGRLKIVSNTKLAASPSPRPANAGVNRGRVAEEPVIRRLQEKFGAEIRSVVDFREKA